MAELNNDELKKVQDYKQTNIVKTLEDKTILRFLNLEEPYCTSALIQHVDSAWRRDEDNYANGSKPMSYQSFKNFRDNRNQCSNEKAYIQMYKECWPAEYKSTEYYKVDLMNKYGTSMGDIEKIKNAPKVPSLDDFMLDHLELPYIDKETKEFTDPGRTMLETLYKTYLMEMWPEYWNCEIYIDKSEVNMDADTLERKEDLCPYTVIAFEEKFNLGRCNKKKELKIEKITEDVISSLKKVNEETSETQKGVSEAMNSSTELMKRLGLDKLTKDPFPQITQILGQIQGLVGGGNPFSNALQKYFDEKKIEIQVNLVVKNMSETMLPMTESNPNGIDCSMFTKEQFKAYEENLKKQIIQCADITWKKYEDIIKNIVSAAKGIWENITSIPQTVSTMVSAAALPQTIPTTGGIPNPAVVVLDILDIIDSILALFPPIIEGIVTLIKDIKTLMLNPMDLPMVKDVVNLVEKIIGAFKNMKKKNEENLVKTIPEQIAKLEAEKRYDEAKNEQTDEYLHEVEDRENRIIELEKEIENLKAQLANINNRNRYQSLSQADGNLSDKDRQFLEDYNNAMINSLEFLVQVEKDMDSISQNVLNGFDKQVNTKEKEPKPPISISKPDTFVMLERQDTTITPFCGRIFQRI